MKVRYLLLVSCACLSCNLVGEPTSTESSKIETIKICDVEECTDACETNDSDCYVKFSQVSVGDDHVCGLTSKKKISCWGDGSYGQTTSPSGEFKYVSTSGSGTCAIDKTDRVICWGSDSGDWSQVPASSFKSIDLGKRQGCGIKLDDTAICWGNLSRQPPTSAIFSKIYVSDIEGACGISDDGSIISWKDSVVAGKFSALALGRQHGCGIAVDDKRIFCWGSNNFGEGSPPDGYYKEISAHSQQNCALDMEGQAHCWPLLDETPEDAFESIDVGPDKVCAVKVDGDVLCWNF